MRFYDFHLRAIFTSILYIEFEIILLKLLPHLPGASELSNGMLSSFQLVGWLVIEVEYLYSAYSKVWIPSPLGHCREQIT